MEQHEERRSAGQQAVASDVELPVVHQDWVLDVFLDYAHFEVLLTLTLAGLSLISST